MNFMDTDGKRMDKKSDVLIVGAGIVGVSSAIWLQKAGLTVTLIDRKGPASETSYGNAGILASASIIPVPTPGIVFKALGMLFNKNQPLFLKWTYLPKFVPFLYKYLKNSNENAVSKISKSLSYLLYDSIEQHLLIAAGTDAEKYITKADLIFGYKNKTAYLNNSSSWEIKRSNGHKSVELSYEELINYDPSLINKFGFGIRCLNHGYIKDPGMYINDLCKSFVDNGGKVIKSEVQDFILDDSKNVAGLKTNQGDLFSDKVVITAGAWSGKLTKKLGVKIPLEAERGYHIEYYEPNIELKSPIVVSDGGFIISSMLGRLRCAGLVEFGGLAAAESNKPFQLLEKKVKKLFPELTYSHIKRWMGHRPSTSDSLPVIGVSPNAPNVWLAYGHQHIGLTAGPKTGKIISEMILSKQSNLDTDPFSATRSGIVC